MEGVIAWLAPILSTIIVTAATASINAKIASGERKRDEARAETDAKRAAEAKWRDEMDVKVDVINESLVCVMRGDLIHKAHRYIDDRGYATIEEKESWHEEWVQYQAVCPKNGFIDTLAEQVMALPEHTVQV